MGSVNDVGTPGMPLDTPPLTDWQEAVRDALNGSDVSVDQRINESSTADNAYTDSSVAAALTTSKAYTDQEVTESTDEHKTYVDQIITVSEFPPGAPPVRDGLIWTMLVPQDDPDAVPALWVSAIGAWFPVISGPGGLDIATANGLYAVIDRTGTSADGDFLDWDTILQPGTYPVVMFGGAPNGPQTGLYYYVMVWAFGTTGNVTQLAVPYNDNEGTLHTRYRYNGVWSAWVPIGASTPPEEIDHGLLMGLGDDDHPQYLTPARGDALYVKQSELEPMAKVWVSSTAPTNPENGDIWVQI